MLQLDHAAALMADRERDIRDVARRRLVPVRPSFLARARKRLATALGPAPVPPAPRSPRVLGRGLGDAVGSVSTRAGDTHGQGAC